MLANYSSSHTVKVIFQCNVFKHYYNYVCTYIILSTVQCTNLSSPTKGNISCNSTGVSHYEDQCSFSCDPGYELTGSSSRQCLSNGSWSGSDVTCDILHCDNLTDGIEYSVLANDCGSEFGSVCRVECNTGYRAVGNNTFTCVSVNDTVERRNGNGGTLQCVIGNVKLNVNNCF